MSDPRIAALAEAIKKATISPEPRSYEDTATAIAREIIRLLPADWCGHDAFWNPPPLKKGDPVDIEALRVDVTDEEADAFLAAIEAQSCGHIGVEEVIAKAQHDAARRDELARQQAAEIARLRDTIREQESEIAWRDESLAFNRAEIARLRPIEEAARAAAAEDCQSPALDALRAALRKDR